jgi:hypothetical protein
VVRGRRKVFFLVMGFDTGLGNSQATSSRKTLSVGPEELPIPWL